LLFVLDGAIAAIAVVGALLIIFALLAIFSPLRQKIFPYRDRARGSITD